MMLLLKKIIHDANRYIFKVSLFLILFMMFMTVADVLGRFLIHPIPGVFELTRYSLAVIVFTSLGWSQIKKVHIAINIIVSRLPLVWQNIIDVFNYALAVVTFSLSFWQMLHYTSRLYNSNLVTTVLRIHVYPWVLVSAIGVLFFALAFLWDLIDAVNKLCRGGEK